jgi:hypothetical protein
MLHQGHRAIYVAFNICIEQNHQIRIDMGSLFDAWELQSLTHAASQ